VEVWGDHLVVSERYTGDFHVFHSDTMELAHVVPSPVGRGENNYLDYRDGRMWSTYSQDWAVGISVIEWDWDALEQTLPNRGPLCIRLPCKPRPSPLICSL